MVNFRSHERTALTFSPGVNVIWGENGSGKTSILEAIYLLSLGRSFKTSRVLETINHNANETLVEGLFTINREHETICFAQSKEARRKIKINDVDVKARDLIGKNPIVLLSPEEQKITKGFPGDRRKYLDKLYATVSNKYLKTLTAYTRILKQRNALLKTEKTEPTLLVWDEQLAEAAVKVWSEKKELCQKFKFFLKEISKSYGQSGVSVILKTKQASAEKKEIMEELKKAIKKDFLRKRTSVGPHTDGADFYYENQALKRYGSQGEHKISLILIKLAEYAFIKTETGKTPTLLLDDLFAKLDFERSDAVLALLEKKAQTIITNTDLVDIERHGIDLNKPENKQLHLERSCKN